MKEDEAAVHHLKLCSYQTFSDFGVFKAYREVGKLHGTA